MSCSKKSGITITYEGIGTFFGALMMVALFGIIPVSTTFFSPVLSWLDGINARQFHMSDAMAFYAAVSLGGTCVFGILSGTFLYLAEKPSCR
jgi:hypothetical protein